MTRVYWDDSACYRFMMTTSTTMNPGPGTDINSHDRIPNRSPVIGGGGGQGEGARGKGGGRYEKTYLIIYITITVVLYYSLTPRPHPHMTLEPQSQLAKIST